MPSRTRPKMDGSGGRVRLKAHYGGDLFISSVDPATTFQELCAEVRGLCRLSGSHPLTLKWVDSEGDPCTVSSQMELEEAFRLACQRRAVLVFHVFPSVPAQPGLPCPGEDSEYHSPWTGPPRLVSTLIPSPCLLTPSSALWAEPGLDSAL
ncbi:protein kinase C zeta type-like [Sorex fumeus]|uniref:protein kinase C zeta type-like n=1 Tax=Sorex fumeus TaxID=62283 RepID=UPI0024AD49BD|nr:protein kinase C zeta type-like [Sorex fumeus]